MRSWWTFPLSACCWTCVCPETVKSLVLNAFFLKKKQLNDKLHLFLVFFSVVALKKLCHRNKQSLTVNFSAAFFRVSYESRVLLSAVCHYLVTTRKTASVMFSQSQHCIIPLTLYFINAKFLVLIKNLSTCASWTRELYFFLCFYILPLHSKTNQTQKKTAGQCKKQ